jgi:hypothetical protein
MNELLVFDGDPPTREERGIGQQTNVLMENTQNSARNL